MILDTIIRTPINWLHRTIATELLKGKVAKAKLPVISSLEASQIIQSIYDGQINIVILDREYVLPTTEIILYIQDNIWLPYVYEKTLSYGSTYDCDSFAGSFYALVSELRLGLCVGIAHYSWYDSTSKIYKAHAVNIIIDNEKKPHFIEPQSKGNGMYDFPEDYDLNFVMLQGREVL